MTPGSRLSNTILIQWRTWSQCAVFLALWTCIMWGTINVQAGPLTIAREDTVVVQDLDSSKERWLADGSFYDIDYLSDQPQQGEDTNAAPSESTSDRCPPVPKKLPTGGCDNVDQCSPDKPCADKQLRCCFNGCVHTCLPEEKPPIYIDWIREPKRRFLDGRSWLIPGPLDSTDVEMCSTSPTEESDDADPLLCPHGYECSIDDPGKPEAGIPNIGHCVKMADVKEMSDPLALKANPGHNEAPQTDAAHKLPIPQGCLMSDDGQVLLSGHSIIIDGRKCLCSETKLECDP
ncbi:yeats domain-containing protein 4-like [Plakobranchus ocellatus]|uniref:Yeats domain-containing protein 4-like n=1 Tax=Plakobranchus ocellatus TaxID=259542 RepID=A0AAV4BQZ8_9GAST|nr:yeats domain-containing protein 4-like [Plakobranchus ocellatus]